MNRSRRPTRKQLGVQINTELWRRLKILAIKQGIAAYEALEAAIREYLENHGDDQQ